MFMKISKETKSLLRAVFSRAAGIFSILFLILSLIVSIFGDWRAVILPAVLVFIGIALVFTRGFFTERKLKRLFRERRVWVVRNKERLRVRASAVVAGDEIFLAAGEIVMFNAVITSAEDLSIMDKNGNSAPRLSGEVAAGEIIAAGTAWAVVSAQIEIAPAPEKRNFLNFVYRKSPSDGENYGETQSAIFALAGILNFLGILLTGLLLVAGIILQRDLIDVLLLAFAAGFAACADRFILAADARIARGIITLARRGVAVKSPSALDKLAGADVLVAPQGDVFGGEELYLAGVFIGGKIFQADSREAACALTFIRLCCNEKSSIDAAALRHGNDGGFEVIGNIPRRRRSILATKEKEAYAVTFGGAAETLKLCDRFFEAGGYAEITHKIRANFLSQIDDLNSNYTHVMAVAAKKYYKTDDENGGYDFFAFALFTDKAAIKAARALSDCRRAGMDCVLLTENFDAAMIKSARKLGIISGAEQSAVLSSVQLSAMDSGLFFANVNQYKVFVNFGRDEIAMLLGALKFKEKSAAIIISEIADTPLAREGGLVLAKKDSPAAVSDSADALLPSFDISVIAAAVRDAKAVKLWAWRQKYIALGLFSAMYSLAALTVALDFTVLTPTIAACVGLFCSLGSHK